MQTSSLTYSEMERFAFITGQPLTVTADELDILDASQFTNEYERVACERVGVDSPEALEALLDSVGTKHDQIKDLLDLVERVACALQDIPFAGKRRDLVDDLWQVAERIKEAAGNLDKYSGGMFANNLSLVLKGEPY